jgi:hypothetical protein
MMENPNVLATEQSVIRRARKQGGSIFGLMAGLQLMVVNLIMGFGAIVGHWRRGMSFEGLIDRLEGDRFSTFVVIFAITTAAAFASTWLMGRWAGKAIQIRQRNYVGFGMLAMLLPAFVTTVTFVLSVDVLLHENFTGSERLFTENFIIPVLLISLPAYIYLLPTSILGGLLTRQYGRKADELEKLKSTSTQ